jgi:hypothetical protein
MKLTKSTRIISERRLLDLVEKDEPTPESIDCFNSTEVMLPRGNKVQEDK